MRSDQQAGLFATRSLFRSLSPLLFAIPLFVLFADGPNASHAFLSGLVLAIGSVLVRRTGESPIILFIFLFQWLQASAPIFHSNWLDIELKNYARIGGSMDSAVDLTLLGLLCLAFGAKVGMGPERNLDRQVLFETARSLSQSILAQFYIIGCLFGYLGQVFAWVVPGLSQPLFALMVVKWASYFFFVYSSIVRQRGERLWLVALAFEFMQGVGGFFSDFKTVIMYTIMAAVAAEVRIKVSSFLGIAIAGSIAIGSGVIWTSIKIEYREFIAAGTGSQVVAVDFISRMEKLFTLIGELDENKISAGAEDMIRRISYVEFFGLAIDHVPSSHPHEGGMIVWDAISRPFMPRLFFPDKAIIDDTERTNLYTGGAGGQSEGTSISLGYVAEAYVDFGSQLMMPALALIGWVYGRIYRLLLRSETFGGLWGMSTATSILFVAMGLDSSFTKVFGGLIVNLLVLQAFNFWIARRFFPWLKRKQL